MTTNFFTFGGLQFWEDVVFAKKWRIQRNYFTKQCRLLDAWNIKRHSGTLESCRTALDKYLKMHQLNQRPQSIIIFIHGLGETRYRFAKMAKHLEGAGYDSAMISYPSTRRTMLENIKVFEDLLSNLTYVTEISFITSGTGGLIAREILNRDSEWKKNMPVRTVIQINPPNRSSRFTAMLGKYRIARKILGPMLKFCESANLEKVPSFEQGTNLGIICTHNIFADKVKNLLSANIKELLPKKDDSFLIGTKDAINLATKTTNPCADKKVIAACISFLRGNSFGF